MRKCSELEFLITGFVDNELTSEEQNLLQNHLDSCLDCRKELERAKNMKTTLDLMAIRTPEDDFWDGYWAGIYNRLERQSAWILCTIGIIFLSAGGVLTLFRDILFAEETPLWVTLGGTVSVGGVVVMIFSLIRERSRINRHERYKDVRR